MGPVKATTRLCVPVSDLWRAVCIAYANRGLTEADALKQARLARILRHEDYDYKQRKPILWNPPS